MQNLYHNLEFKLACKTKFWLQNTNIHARNPNKDIHFRKCPLTKMSNWQFHEEKREREREEYTANYEDHPLCP